MRVSQTPAGNQAAVYAPSGGDQGAAISSGLTAAAGKELAILPGSYALTTSVTVPSNATMIAGPDVTISGLAADGSDFTDCPIFTPKAFGANTILSSSITYGSSTLHVTSSAAFAAGGYAVIYNGDVAAQYQVTPGVGTLTTDRPVLFPFANSTAVYVVTPTLNTSIDFGGATLNATHGHRAMWMPYNWRCHYRNLVINCSTLTFGFDVDLASVDVVADDITVNFVARTPTAVAIEGGADGTAFARVKARGSFSTAFQVSGRFALTDCEGTGFTTYGLKLQASGALDTFAAYLAIVRGGQWRGGQFAVVVQDNSARCTIEDVTTGGAAQYGVLVASGTNVVTTGVADTILRGCRDEGSAVSFGVGDGSSGAARTLFQNCGSFGATADGFVVQSDATGTRLAECLAQGGTSAAGYGFSFAGTVHGSNLRSEGNAGRGLYVTGTTIITGYTSSGDATSGGREAVKIDVTGSLTLVGARLSQAAAATYQWNGIYNNSTGTSTLADVSIVMVSASTPNVGVYAVAAGALYLRDVRVTGTGTGNYGLYVAAGTVEIGPGCAFDAMANPVTIAGGTVTIVQAGGVAAVSATGSLTFAQHYCNAIELAAGAAANSTITAIPFIGARFTARNLTAAKTLTIITSTAGDTGVTIAAGKSAIVEVRASDAKMVRVTADV